MTANEPADVTIGGKTWSVPILVARQNQIIDPLVLKVMPIFVNLQKDKVFGLANITPEIYKDFQEICFTAMKAAQKDLTRDQFLDMPVTLTEMITAFPIIAKQTGIFLDAPVSGVIKTGEA